MNKMFLKFKFTFPCGVKMKIGPMIKKKTFTEVFALWPLLFIKNKIVDSNAMILKLIFCQYLLKGFQFKFRLLSTALLCVCHGLRSAENYIAFNVVFNNDQMIWNTYISYILFIQKRNYYTYT